MAFEQPESEDNFNGGDPPRHEKNVLIISYYFPPMGLSGVQRTLKFVKYLPDFGWHPYVLSTTPAAFYAFDESLAEEIEDKPVQVFRTPPKDFTKFLARKKKNFLLKFPGYLKQKIGSAILQTIYQPDSRVKWKQAAIQLGEEIIREHDIKVIFATAPPFTDFLVAKELSEKFNIPFIVDYRDIWVDNPFHFYATPWHKHYAQRLETEILKKTTRAIVTTRYAKQLLIERYRFLGHEDVRIIHHGYDSEDFLPVKNVKPNPRKFTITHSGVFQDDRTPKYFLQAVKNFLTKIPEAGAHFEARFVGIMRRQHSKLIKKYKLEANCVCTGYVEHSESVRQLMESDVLWLMLRDTVRSPGKMYEYFGARKPLLVCAPEGVIRKTAQETKAALVTDPADVKAIELALETYYLRWKAGTLPRPSEEFVAQFDRRNLTGELARELSIAAHI